MTEEELANWRAVLSTPAGQMVLGHVIRYCRPFASVVKDPETGEMEVPEMAYHNAGIQDVGHWVMERMYEADPMACNRMQMKALERRLMEDKR